MYKNIIFDLDMTLIETSDGIFNLLEKLCKNFFEHISKEKFKSELVLQIRKAVVEYQNFEFMKYGIGDMDIFFEKSFDRHVGYEKAQKTRIIVIKNTLKNLNLNAEFDEIINYIMDNWLDFRLIEGAEEMLMKLSDYKLFLLTDGMKETQLARARQVGLEKYFYKMYASEYFGMSKIYSKPFEVLLDENDLKAEETIMVGDNINSDIRSSVKVGITPIYFNRDKKVESEYINVHSPREVLKAILKLKKA